MLTHSLKSYMPASTETTKKEETNKRILKCLTDIYEASKGNFIRGGVSSYLTTYYLDNRLSIVLTQLGYIEGKGSSSNRFIRYKPSALPTMNDVLGIKRQLAAFKKTDNQKRTQSIKDNEHTANLVKLESLSEIEKAFLRQHRQAYSLETFGTLLKKNVQTITHFFTQEDEQVAKQNQPVDLRAILERQEAKQDAFQQEVLTQLKNIHGVFLEIVSELKGVPPEKE